MCQFFLGHAQKTIGATGDDPNGKHLPDRRALITAGVRRKDFRCGIQAAPKTNSKIAMCKHECLSV
jgi:hypothetical protein